MSRPHDFEREFLPFDPFRGRAFTSTDRLLLSPMAACWLISTNLFTVAFPGHSDAAGGAIMDALGVALLDADLGTEVIAAGNVFHLDSMSGQVTVRLDLLDELWRVKPGGQEETVAAELLDAEGERKTTATFILIPKILWIVKDGAPRDIADLCGETYETQLLSTSYKPIADEGQPVSMKRMPREVRSNLSVIASVKIGNPKRGRVAKAHIRPRREQGMILAIAFAHLELDNGGQISPELQALVDNTLAPFLPEPPLEVYCTACDWVQGVADDRVPDEASWACPGCGGVDVLRERVVKESSAAEAEPEVEPEVEPAAPVEEVT